MKILILGGTSFFGAQTARIAVSGGHHVVVFSRRDLPPDFPFDVKLIRGDRTLEADLSRLSLETWDVIFDNICYTQMDAQKSIKKFSGRCGLYVMTSSEAVYYLVKDLASPFREKHTEIFKDSIELKKGGFWDYASGKYLAEQEFIRAFEKIKFPVCIIRPPIIIGPGDNTLRAYSYWVRIADGYPFFAPGWDFSKRFAFSNDMASWILKIMENQKSVAGEIFNLGDSEIISLREFLKISADIMNKPLLAIPGDFKWLKENGFDMTASPYSSKRNYVLDIEKAQNFLKLKSTPLRAWLEESIRWFLFDYSGPKPSNYATRRKEIELCNKWIEERKL